VTAITNRLTARTQALSEVGGTTVEGTAETVGDTTKKAGGGVKGALGKLPGRKKGKAEEEKVEEEKPEEESDEGEEEEQARKPRPTKEQGRQPHKSQASPS
jgi:hypothetical protein